MQFFPSPDGQHIAIRLDTDDLLLESIAQVCREADIKTGAIVAGYGALKFLHIHVGTVDHYPPQNKYLKWLAPLEICSLTGIIADHEPHIHISAGNEEKMLGGHLEPGTVVLYLCEIMIRRLDDMSLTRQPDEHGLNVLQSGRPPREVQEA
jgi:predicted DNA-binding protein with PD1-like motif